MRITGLEITDFMKIKAFSLNPDGSPLIVIGGENEEGKSAVLNAIEALMDGARKSPKEAIRQGAKRSKIVLKTDRFVATCDWTAKRRKLVVKSLEGATYPSPQSMLSDFYSSLTVDPGVLLRMKPRERAEMMRKLVGLDFTQEDGKRQTAYDDRTRVGRELKVAQGQLDGMPESEKDLGEPLSVAKLMAELDAGDKANAEIDGAAFDLEALRQEAAEQQGEISALEKKLTRAKKCLDEIVSNGKKAAEKAESLEGSRVDLVSIKDCIGGAEATNAKIAAAHERIAASKKVDELEADQERLTAYISEIDAVKNEALASATYPVPGLSVSDEDVLIDGLPFEQASQARRIRCSVAMALASNPEFRVLLIRDGSLLDKKNLALLSEAAVEADAQIWIERVGDDGGCTVVIEDGEIKAQEPPK